LICGDRNWTDREKIRDRILKLINQYGNRSLLIIEGAARGADTIAGAVASGLQVSLQVFPAQWDKYHRAAGPIRNRQMLDEKPDLVIAFHSNLENSKGTKDCVQEAKKRGIPVEVIT